MNTVERNKLSHIWSEGKLKPEVLDHMLHHGMIDIIDWVEISSHIPYPKEDAMSHSDLPR